MSTNVPPIVFTPVGPELPQESAILAGVRADIDSAFGGGVNPAVETPQGQIASSLSRIIADKNEQIALFVAQVDPDTSSGAFQDAIARLYFLDRKPGTPTAVACLCTGGAFTVIPAGSQAQDTSGNTYISTQTVQIPFEGNVTIQFVNVVDGPIPCPAGTLTTIVSAVNGWESITNLADGVLGNLVESQSAFAFRRAQSVALNGRGSLPSIYAAVFDVPGVIDVCVRENTTNAVVTNGATNYPLAPHSLYVAAIGGNADEIGKAIWLKKDVGCDYNGNTSVVVTDESGYLPPLPTYTVKFQIPAALPILFAVNIASSPDLPMDIVSRVKNTIIAVFTGEYPGSTRVRIGSLLRASSFYNAINLIDSSVALLSIKLGPITATLDSFLIGIDQAPTVDASNIAVNLI